MNGLSASVLGYRVPAVAYLALAVRTVRTDASTAASACSWRLLQDLISAAYLAHALSVCQHDQMQGVMVFIASLGSRLRTGCFTLQLHVLTVRVLSEEQNAVPSTQERQRDSGGTGSASLEARLKASEDWRTQQETRMQLEDKWKAGHEEAFNHWRTENDARVRVEEDWKALHESRMVNVRSCPCSCPRLTRFLVTNYSVKFCSQLRSFDQLSAPRLGVKAYCRGNMLCVGT